MKRNDFIGEKEKTGKIYLPVLILAGILLAGFCLFVFRIIDNYTGPLLPDVYNKAGADFSYHFLNLTYPSIKALNFFFKAFAAMIFLVIFIQLSLTGRMKPRVINIICVLTVFTFIIITEIRLNELNRGQQWRPHPLLLWENPADTILTYPDRNLVLTYNHEGFRNNEDFPLQKPAGEKRVLFIGDSAIFGFNLPYENSEANILEKLLNEYNISGSRWKVLNAAVMGHTTFQGKYFLRERGLKYSPDYVIVAYNNDADIRYPESPEAGNRTVLPLRILLHRSEIYLALRKAVMLTRLKREHEKFRKKMEDDPRPRVSEEEFRENLAYIIELSKKQGAVPVIINMPRARERMNPYHDIMKDSVRDKGGIFLDLFTLFKKQNFDEECFFPGDDMHLNEQGAFEAAKSIFDVISKSEENRNR